MSDDYHSDIEWGRRLVGQNIRRLRHQQNLSQKQLANKSGLNRAYLSTVENGRRNIGIDNIMAVVLALQVDPRELFEPVDLDGE